MIRTQLTALSYIRNWRVALVFFLIIPILNLLFLVMIAGSATQKFDWQVASASVLISGALLSLSSMSRLFVDDNNRGIALEMLIRRPFSLAYWGSKMLVSSLAGEAMIIINTILLRLINEQEPIGTMILISPIVIFGGIILGMTASIASWRMRDPYFFPNLISAVGYLVSGTIVALAHYPDWMRWLSNLFPFAHSTTALRLNRPIIALADVPIIMGWILVGVVVYVWQIKHVTKNSWQRDIL